MPTFFDNSISSEDSKTSETDINTTDVIGSYNIVKSIFDAINKNIFNDALKGVDVKWVTILKSRTALSVNTGTDVRKETIIYLSSSLLSKCTRKQLVESILYEMVFVYIWSKLLKPMTTSFDKDPIDDDERTKRLQAFIKRAIDFLNRKAGTTLSFNYPIHAHHTTQKFNEWIGIDEDLQHHKFNDSVICILDDDSDDDDLESIRKTGSELIGGKVEIQPIADREWTLTHHNNSFCVCCMDYNKLFAECFAGTNFDLNLNLKSMENDPFVKCLLCCEMAGRDSLNAHFDDACSLFRA